ncbi:MAG: sodium:solute symporter family protein [Verrucomicrobiota bacterium]
MKIATLIGVFLYELLIVGGVGLWLHRRSKTETQQADEFALGGRSLPTPVLAVTLALTVLGTAHILGVFEMTFLFGAAAIWFSIAHVILLVVVCLTTGLWMRRLGLTTVPEILRSFFGPRTETAVSCVMAGAIFGILTLEAQGLGIVMQAMTGWSIQQGAIVGSVIGILYVILFGMKEVGWINLINAVILYIGIILATIFVALKLPGGSYASVADHFADRPHMLSIFGTKDILLTFGVGTCVAVLFSQGISQMLLQPAMAAKSEKSIKRALWIAAPVNGLFGVFIVVLGLTAMSIPDFANMENAPKVASTAMLVAYLPSWLSTLLLASFLAAILSTFAMTSLAPATIFSVNIYKNLFAPNASEREIANVTRIAIVILGIIAMAIAASLPPILAAITWLFSWLIPIFWVVVFGFTWKRSGVAAITTLVAAWIANCLWSFTSINETLGIARPPGPDHNAYVTLVVTLVVGVLSHLLFRGKPGYFHSPEYQQSISQTS